MISDLKQTYSDLITIEEVMKWEKGKIQLFNGGTGTGKTFFATNTLAKNLPKGSKILFLCNRKSLREEVFLDVVKKHKTKDIVDVMTYHKLINMLLLNEKVLQYDFIICDEAHFLTVDCKYVDKVDLFYNWIAQQNSRIIFMTATYQIVKMLILDKIQNEYKIDMDYSYVEKLELLYGKHDIENRIFQLLKDTKDKIVYFASSAKEAYRIYLMLGNENAHFYCSNNNKDFSRHSEAECIKNNTFKKRVLITTTVLNNGINLFDKSIKHILTDIYNLDDLQQCLGRKRIINEDDTCNFYIKVYNNKTLGGKKAVINKKLGLVNSYYTDKSKFKQTYINSRGFKGLDDVFDIVDFNCNNDESVNIVVNETRHYALKIESVYIEGMLRVGYETILLNRLGKTISKDIITTCNDRKGEIILKSELELYLESIVDKRLFEEDRKELIEKLNIRRDGKQMKSVGVLDSVLKEEYNMQVISKRVKIKNKLVTVWEVSYV